MANFPLTAADIGVAIVLLLSAVLAFARGFVHESLSVASWIGAIIAVIFGLPILRPFARDLISLPLLADVAAAFLIFIVTLIALSLLIRMVTKQVRDSPLNAVDRSLGFAFGLARGAALVCLAYIPIQWMMPPTEQPAWLRDARSMPLVERGADALRSFFEPTAAGAPPSADDRARKDLETERVVRDISRPEPKSTPAEPTTTEHGYTDRERRDLERLLDNER